MATHKSYVLAIPCKVFAIKLAINKRHVLRFPEGILRVYDGVVNLHVLRILERVVAVLMVVVDAYVVRVHEEVVGICNLDILQCYIRAVPKRFLCIWEVGILYIDTFHATEHLRGFYLAVGHSAVRRVPE